MRQFFSDLIAEESPVFPPGSIVWHYLSYDAELNYSLVSTLAEHLASFLPSACRVLGSRCPQPEREVAETDRDDLREFTSTVGSHTWNCIALG
jgi:hypothetical protein